MTARPRQASEGANAAASLANGTEAVLSRCQPFAWEEWFRHANAQQRAEALGLAQQQGILYPHQLPHLSNGTKAVENAAETRLAQTLPGMLTGKTDTLCSFSLPKLSFFDTELDELQQQAVLRALGTPDVLLLQGLPGTGKSRVLAEIVLQAVARGWRVLFLAARPCSLDVVLQRLLGRQAVFALRYLDPAEKPEALPAWLRGLTLEEQRQAFLERVLVGARAKRQQGEASCQQRKEEEPIWSELRTCLEQGGLLEQRQLELHNRSAQLQTEVEHEAQTGDPGTPLAARLAQLCHTLEESLQQADAALQNQQTALAQVEQETAELKRAMTDLEPAYRAKKGKHFWTLGFWQHVGNSQILHDMEKLQVQLASLQARQQSLIQEIAQGQAHRSSHQDHFDSEKIAVLRDEVQARTQLLEQARTAIEQERRLLDERWKGLCRRLAEQPLEPTPAALEAAQQNWLRQKKNNEEQCLFARQWMDFIEQTGPQLATRLPALANVLAGTMTACQTDPQFLAAAMGPFDLLVLEDADTLTEADLMKAIRQVQRCVLVGPALTESTPSAPKNIEKSARPFAIAPLASIACWPKLWQNLGGDAGLWPYSWSREQGRLLCQLLALTKEDRQYLDREGLVDAAEIELRILHRPKTTPRLAQILFPADWTFAQAFAFIVREAQEIPIQPLCRTGWWHEDTQRCTWQTAPASLRIDIWLDLEPGIRLGTVADEQGDAARLARIEFASADGWDRPKADAWLDRYRPSHDHGRCLFLQTPHRFTPALAKTITRLVCSEAWLSVAAPACLSDEPAFEFCAVPAWEHEGWPKDGAGLELDLAATRHADRLPLELRHGLPPRGFVNYLEAQALVRRLETLVQEGEMNASGSACRIAVLALYASQVELLRRLIARSEMLRSSSCELEVSLPSQMHQRECDLVLLSLTRSHSHRTGAFGEDVHELPLALTRARGRLLVFGDAGMLCKRTHWQGPLDHLDAHASHQEHLRLSRLFACVQQQAKTLLLANGR